MSKLDLLIKEIETTIEESGGIDENVIKTYMLFGAMIGACLSGGDVCFVKQLR